MDLTMTDLLRDGLCSVFPSYPISSIYFSNKLKFTSLELDQFLITVVKMIKLFSALEWIYVVQTVIEWLQSNYATSFAIVIPFH